ncbi:hypothetical protein HZC33_03265 [Candidatus Wolfebacteria bacterium]|nr:hypothetical protein [Candidatus Wolfebacteria bacterium]
MIQIIALLQQQIEILKQQLARQIEQENRIVNVINAIPEKLPANIGELGIPESQAPTSTIVATSTPEFSEIQIECNLIIYKSDNTKRRDTWTFKDWASTDNSEFKGLECEEKVVKDHFNSIEERRNRNACYHFQCY